MNIKNKSKETKLKVQPKKANMALNVFITEFRRLYPQFLGVETKHLRKYYKDTFGHLGYFYLEELKIIAFFISLGLHRA